MQIDAQRSSPGDDGTLTRASGTRRNRLPRPGFVPPKAPPRRRFRSSGTPPSASTGWPTRLGGDAVADSDPVRRPHQAARLAELANDVAGPRAAAAATHAAALAARVEQLLDASRHYEDFGDRLAAVDAAAQAVVIYQRSDRGSAMNTFTTLERLAAQCQGVQTPAIRASATPQLFTDRQHEIISLAAQGLSNKEIADRLTMSRRSVEGHLFRASRRVGANSREQLIAILQGR